MGSLSLELTAVVPMLSAVAFLSFCDTLSKARRRPRREIGPALGRARKDGSAAYRRAVAHFCLGYCEPTQEFHRAAERCAVAFAITADVAAAATVAALKVARERSLDVPRFYASPLCRALKSLSVDLFQLVSQLCQTDRLSDESERAPEPLARVSQYRERKCPQRQLICGIQVIGVHLHRRAGGGSVHLRARDGVCQSRRRRFCGAEVVKQP